MRNNEWTARSVVRKGIFTTTQSSEYSTVSSVALKVLLRLLNEQATGPLDTGIYLEKTSAIVWWKDSKTLRLTFVYPSPLDAICWREESMKLS